MQPLRRTTSADVDRLIEAVLHDVRTPLAAATGWLLRLIREGRGPGEQSTHVLEQAQASLRSMRCSVRMPTSVAGQTMEPSACRCRQPGWWTRSSCGGRARPGADTGTWPATATVESAATGPELCHLPGHALGVGGGASSQNDAAGTISIVSEGGVFTVSAALPVRYNQRSAPAPSIRGPIPGSRSLRVFACWNLPAVAGRSTPRIARCGPNSRWPTSIASVAGR